MSKSLVKNRYRPVKKARIGQGDIYRDLRVSLGAGEGSLFSEFSFEYVVILSQDCDLEWDGEARKAGLKRENDDKILDTILVAPAFPSEKFTLGEHIEGKNMRTVPRPELDKIKANNEKKRYHYLPSDSLGLFPDMIVDFKMFFTVPSKSLYKIRTKNYVISLSELFREEISQRFSNYLARVALPDV